MNQSPLIFLIRTLSVVCMAYPITMLGSAPDAPSKVHIIDSKCDPATLKSEGWQLPHPPYPNAARAQREQGSLVVEIVTGENGKLVEASVPKSKSHPTLDLWTARWAFAKWSGPPYHRMKVPLTYELR